MATPLRSWNSRPGRRRRSTAPSWRRMSRPSVRPIRHDVSTDVSFTCRRRDANAKMFGRRAFLVALTCPNCGNTRTFLVKTLQMHVVQVDGDRVDVAEEGRP